MPIRIYALAKQLKLDSKVLVDICTKAGVTGKGSALASLTDEETAKVTAFVDPRQGRPARRPRARPWGMTVGGSRHVGASGARTTSRRRHGGRHQKIPVLPGKPAESRLRC